MRILLIRHGQSEGNIKKVFCGKIDFPPTEKGKEQGAVACEYIYANYKVCAIYASELTRARQTVKRLSELTGIPVSIKPQFNELFGGKWENETVPYIAEHYPEDFKVWEENVGEARPTGGESFKELADRAFKGLRAVVEECGEKDGVAVVATHGGVIRTIQCLLSGLPLSEMKNIPWVNNSSITEIKYADGKFVLGKIGYDEFLGEKRTAMFMGL